MIHDEICTYEVCKLAKEKGFNVQTFGWYDYTGNYHKGFIPHELQECPRYKEYYAPTQSLLQRWLREMKGIHIVIESEPTTTTSSNMLFQWIINYNSDGECYDCYNDIRAYPSYEKTLESALKFALENLA